MQDWIDQQIRKGVEIAPLAASLGVTDRTVRRIRRGITGHKPPQHTEWWARFQVEDMLARAGVDFYALYPEFEAADDVPLEPDAWCSGCREVITPIYSTCPWCETLVTKWQEAEAA